MSDGVKCYDKNKAGSWNNKRTLMKNQRNLSKTCSLASNIGTVFMCLFVITEHGYVRP